MLIRLVRSYVHFMGQEALSVFFFFLNFILLFYFN